MTLREPFFCSFLASFPTGPATEQMVDVRFRSTASWLLAIAKFLVVRDNWGDLQQIMLSQGKWKLTMAAPASDLFVVCLFAFFTALWGGSVWLPHMSYDFVSLPECKSWLCLPPLVPMLRPQGWSVVSGNTIRLKTLICGVGAICGLILLILFCARLLRYRSFPLSTNLIGSAT